MKELEYEIVGSFITDPNTHYLIDTLSIEDFTVEHLRVMFIAIRDLRNKHKEITMYEVAQTAKLSLKLIAEATAQVISTSRIEANIKTLRERTIKRNYINTMRELLSEAQESTDIMQLKYSTIKAISEIQDIEDTEVIPLSQAITETYALLEDRANKKADKGYYTGMTRFDIATAGLHPEELTTVGARPGVGKTILGMQWGLQIARNGKKVLFTSLEMSVSQLCERILSSNTNIDNQALRKGEIEGEQWGDIVKASQLYSLNTFLIDKTSRNIQHIRAKIIKYKPELVIIDYLQLLHPAQREQSREREVAVITRDLKLMSLEFKIPIVILSQLNRNAEGKRPSMADLRESGAIEQDSDNIVFIHEPTTELDTLIQQGHFQGIDVNAVNKRGDKLTQIIIEKQRNGRVGTIDMIKVPNLMKFLEIKE